MTKDQGRDFPRKGTVAPAGKMCLGSVETGITEATQFQTQKPEGVTRSAQGILDPFPAFRDAARLSVSSVTHSVVVTLLMVATGMQADHVPETMNVSKPSPP